MDGVGVRCADVFLLKNIENERSELFQHHPSINPSIQRPPRIDPPAHRRYDAHMNVPAPKLLTHCPLCDAAYGDGSVRPLGESGATRLYHLTCPACAHSVLAVILEHASGVSSIGLVTDLEAQDAFRFRDANPISSDDCVRAHEALARDSAGLCKRLAMKQ